MGVFQQVRFLFHTFPKFRLCFRRKLPPLQPAEEMRIVYLMKGVLYHLRYHFSWSRGYDAYALDKRDELQRCAFLMAHLLFEWVGGLVRRPPSYHILIVITGFDRHGCAGVEQVESWRTAGTFWVNPACLPEWMSHRLRIILHGDVLKGAGAWWRWERLITRRCHRRAIWPRLCSPRQSMPDYFSWCKNNFCIQLVTKQASNSIALFKKKKKKKVSQAVKCQWCQLFNNLTITFKKWK